MSNAVDALALVERSRVGSGTGTSSGATLQEHEHSIGHAEADAGNTDDSSSASPLLTFPEQLMMLLNSGSVDDSMRWLPSGDAFCLVPSTVANRVLEPHFRCCKFESFTRKLNRWGFRRVAGQPVPAGTIAYFHRSFHRDKPEELSNMSGRKTSNKAKPIKYYKSKSVLLDRGGRGQSALAARRPVEGSHTTVLAEARTMKTEAGGEEDLGVVKRSSMGSWSRSSNSISQSGSTYLSSVLPPHQLAGFLEQQQPQSRFTSHQHSANSARLGTTSALQEGDLERAIRIQLLSKGREQHPSAHRGSADLATRMILASTNHSNSTNSGGVSDRRGLPLDDWLSSTSSQGLLTRLLPSHLYPAAAAGLSTAELSALLRSQHGVASSSLSSTTADREQQQQPVNRNGDAALVARLLGLPSRSTNLMALGSTMPAAPAFPSSSSSRSSNKTAASRQLLLESGLLGAAGAASAFALAQSTPSASLSQGFESNSNNQAQLLQLYRLEQERQQVLRQTQARRRGSFE